MNIADEIKRKRGGKKYSLYLTEETTEELREYCRSNNIAISRLIDALIVDYVRTVLRGNADDE